MAPASKGRRESGGLHGRSTLSFGQALATLVMAAMLGEVNFAYITPVYGSFNAALAESWSLDAFAGAVSSLIIAASVLRCHDASSQYRVHTIPLLGTVIPVYVAWICSMSGQLGPSWGPLASVIPNKVLLVMASSAFAAVSIDRFTGPKSQTAENALNISIAVVIPALSVFASRYCARYLIASPGLEAITLRYGYAALQCLLVGYYVVLSRGFLIALTIALFALTAFDPHLLLQHNISRTNARLASKGYTVLDRAQSVTGYISVLENVKDGYRALRCDHSLLGGEWQRYPPTFNPRLKEPIYGVFVMLEAVRLVQSEEAESNADQPYALFIGLGIGTSPTAFITHGINTTIVEIDPMVHQYAIDHFGLPPNHTAVIQDALTFMHNAENEQAGHYDFIIHDVFTGSAEPLELFTVDFISGLYRLLAAKGVIAINYAGDLNSAVARAVVHTALSVFPACRLFRETPQSSMTDVDLTNMVIFCCKDGKQSTDPSVPPFQFRQPREADYLGSDARREFLMPRHEIDLSKFVEFDGGAPTAAALTPIDDYRLKNDPALSNSQKQNAKDHWRLMRSIIPAKVWESW